MSGSRLRTRNEFLASLLFLALVALLPIWVTSTYWQGLFVVSMYFALLAVAWNLLAGYTGQFSLAPTAFDNLIVAGCAVGLGYHEAQARADALIGELGLGEVRDEDGANLSGGQQKLLEFGCMFMGDPKLSVLDEPFAAIHPTMREIMVRIIKGRHAAGQTFLVVSHDIPAVIDLRPRLVVMNAGSVIAEGAFESVLNDPEVIEAYLGGAAA